MRVSILAPIKTSLYSRLVTHLLSAEPGVELGAVIVRTPWTWGRIRGEIRRDGARLLWKAYRKMVLGDQACDSLADGEDIYSLAHRCKLPGRTLADLAAIHGFQVAVVKDHNDQQAQELLQAARPDVIVFTGGGLVRRQILQIPTIGVLNCHLGILPAFRGMDVVEWPLVDRDQDDEIPKVGLTVHLMDEGLDTGGILLQRAVEVRSHDTFASLRSRLEPAMVAMMQETVCGLRDCTLKAVPQKVRDGRQYFVMHSRMADYARQRLQRYQASLITPKQ